MGLLHVSTLQSGDDGSTEVHLLDDIDQTLSNGITSHNTSEDVDEDGSDLGVAGDELEGRSDSSRGGTTADVKEVGRASTVKLDDVHSGHGETSTVDLIAEELVLR